MNNSTLLNLNRNKLNYVELRQVTLIDPSKKDLKNITPDLYVSFGMMADLGEHERTFSPKDVVKIGDVINRGYSFFRNDDILLAKMTPCFENGKGGIAKNLVNGIGFGSTEFYVIRVTEKLLPDFLYYIISSNKFIDDGKLSLVGTTGRRRLLKQFVESYKIPLLPIDEQQRIVALFQSLDKCIVETVNILERIKQLRQNLTNKLRRESPKFGNLIDLSKTTKTKIGNVSIEVSDRVENPATAGFEKFVGLDCFESGEFRIKKWNSPDKLKSAMKLFIETDVLFARRNAYLKRASYAPMEGICSGDVIVIRAKENKIKPKFLTLILNTSVFWDYAIANAAGSMSKRVKWRDLANYSFDLPDIETQEKILIIFDQVESIIDLYIQQLENLKTLKRKLLNDILG